MSTVSFDDSTLDRMVQAVDRVRSRLTRAVSALNAARIPYAIVGSSAVAAQIAKVDESAVRFTNDVDILLNRSDFERLHSTLSMAGFVALQVGPKILFAEGLENNHRHSLRIIFANELVRESDLEKAPPTLEADDFGEARILRLQPLVSMLLTDNRLNSRVDLRDMIDVGLIDATWPARFIPDLGARLQALLDDPEG
jgi:hypothetical protein